MTDLARTNLARQLLTDTGIVGAYSPAVAEGHSVENNGKVILHVCNESEDPVTVTLRTAYTRNGLKLADREVEVAAGTSVFIGPLDPVTYNQSDGGAGQVYIDYSAVEGVTAVALLVP